MNKLKLISKFALVIISSFQLISCGGTSNIKPTPTPTSSLPLFTRLGGNYESISIISEDFMQNVLLNSSLKEVFSDLSNDKEKLKNYNKKITDYICEISKGGCTFVNDNSLVKNLTQEQYNTFKGEITKTLDKFRVLANDKTDLTNIFDPLKVGMFVIIVASPVPQVSVSGVVTQTSGSTNVTQSPNPTTNPSIIIVSPSPKAN